MKVVSFFAGCGGMDLGFRQAGFEVMWANEFDKRIRSDVDYEPKWRNKRKRPPYLDRLIFT